VVSLVVVVGSVTVDVEVISDVVSTFTVVIVLVVTWVLVVSGGMVVMAGTADTLSTLTTLKLPPITLNEPSVWLLFSRLESSLKCDMFASITFNPIVYKLNSTLILPSLKYKRKTILN
jgi:hypothetical protein